MAHDYRLRRVAEEQLALRFCIGQLVLALHHPLEQSFEQPQVYLDVLEPLCKFLPQLLRPLEEQSPLLDCWDA